MHYHKPVVGHDLPQTKSPDWLLMEENPEEVTAFCAGRWEIHYFITLHFTAALFDHVILSCKMFCMIPNYSFFCDEVVRVVRPVQQPDDLWHSVTFVRQDGEGDLFRKGVWMIRLEDRQFL